MCQTGAFQGVKNEGFLIKNNITFIYSLYSAQDE